MISMFSTTQSILKVIAYLEREKRDGLHLFRSFICPKKAETENEKPLLLEEALYTTTTKSFSVNQHSFLHNFGLR